MQKGQVCGKCMGGGGDKCRKVKCAGGVWEVCGRCAGGGGDKCRKVKCAVGAPEVCGRWWG